MVVVEGFSLLCFVTIPPSTPIKGVHRCLHFSLFIELVKFESQCNYNYSHSFQQGYGDIEESDDIESSQESEHSSQRSTSSEEMESSQEEEEHIDP